RGQEYPLGYSLYEDDYELEKDTEIRRTAFREFYAKLRQYENVTATAYNAYVRTDKTMATLRGYGSVFDYLLSDQKVTREMYDRQIDVITEKLAPHMRRYARLLQKKHGLQEMTFADIKIAVDPEYDPHVTIAEAEEYVKKGLAVLGEDYVGMVEEAFRDRWFDFAKNQGKCTGGFCSSPYGRNSFILLTWNNRMADVFTIAHELGHAGHFRLCNKAQSLYDTEVSTYFVEAPSTMNEVLMTQYLLKTNEDKRFRRWVLSCMIANTYYHNFVTHLREAWYQREVYRIIDQGGSVNAEVLSDLYRKNLELFWGDAVSIPEGAELVWMRQPHYYMGLYSYTYSAGLTVATEAARRIEREGQPAVEDWKKVLEAGSTKTPAELAAMAGIDITTDAPLLRTIDYIGGIIDEICRLTEELDGIRVD
ncbi:MAG: oligoendopeptidase F, partial [Lachnospiraceae bacterium]|nr:oligoendopeptidase F [Lachnospiraceae bacterium]